jgi:hypothetical protein
MSSSNLSSSRTVKKVVLFDLDSEIPNLALMKLSAYWRERGARVNLQRGKPVCLPGNLHFASAVFHTRQTQVKVDDLRRMYGEDVIIGGTGVDVYSRLPAEVEDCFPDYRLYGHVDYALGFLTRGCDQHCPFCLVPKKEGGLQAVPASFDGFVPRGQKKIMLLDNNLLAHPAAEELLRQMIRRKYEVNFNQSLDIRYLTEKKAALLRQVECRNRRFTKWMLFFACNDVVAIREFEEKAAWLRAFGMDHLGVLLLYGFNTCLSEDYQRLLLLRRNYWIPFLLEYRPLPGTPPASTCHFFDMDLKEVIRLTFRSNGLNWEKYLRWLNRRYFAEFGFYYLPLLRVIYRYNNREGIRCYLDHPDLLSETMYASHPAAQPPDRVHADAPPPFPGGKRSQGRGRRNG